MYNLICFELFCFWLNPFPGIKLFLSEHIWWMSKMKIEWLLFTFLSAYSYFCLLFREYIVFCFQIFHLIFKVLKEKEYNRVSKLWWHKERRWFCFQLISGIISGLEMFAAMCHLTDTTKEAVSSNCQLPVLICADVNYCH